MASKESFFKAHWDWLVMGAGVLALAGSAAVFVGRLGVSPEDGAMRCEERLRSVRPAHEGVAPADMTLFHAVIRTAQTPPVMVEVDPQKASFLASGKRIVCKAEKDSVSGDGRPVKGCGRPIPADSKTCPFCNVVQDTGLTKEEEGVRRMREWSAQHGVDLLGKPDADSDGDGFTDMEEYECAKAGGPATNPKDASSHPDYLESLFVEGEMQQTFLPFWFEAVSPIPGGFRFSFRDASNRKNAYGQATVYRVLKGEEIGKTGYSVANHEKRMEERIVPGSGGKMKRKVEVQVVELVRKDDGKKIVARLGSRKVPVDRQVNLSFRRGAGKTFAVKPGDTFKLYSMEYRVISLGNDPKAPQVKVREQASGSESVITSSGKVK